MSVNYARIEGAVETLHGEKWLILLELEGGFCLAVKDGDIVPAKVYLVYCGGVTAKLTESNVIL